LQRKIRTPFLLLDDAAAASIVLGKAEEPPGEVWDVLGPGSLTGREFIEMSFKTAGTRLSGGWLPETVCLLACSFSDAREVRDLVYPFEQPMDAGQDKVRPSNPRVQL
jgi:hypothetical protein